MNDSSQGRALYSLDMGELLVRQTSARSSGIKPESGVARTIGIDGRVFQFDPSMTRGIGHYTINHLVALISIRPDWKFVFCFDEVGAQPESLREFLKFENVSWTRFDDIKKPFDLLHIPDFFSPIGFYDSPYRIYPAGPYSVILYDLTPYALPKLHFDCWSELMRMGYLHRIKRISAGDTAILAISEFSRRDLMQRFGVSGDLITPIMAGLNSANCGQKPSPEKTADIKKSLGLNKPFFLWVGALDVHKNPTTAITAFKVARESVDIQMVMLGCGGGSAAQSVRQKLADAGISDVIIPGFLSREDMEALYGGAAGLVFPSLYEGFGFPVLESMACGCPVISSSSSSLPEVAGNAAILLDPHDIRGFANSMVSLAADPSLRRRMSEAGVRRAAEFSWKKTAQKTIEAWEALLSKRCSIEVIRENKGY